jgi:hypothetical protein
MRKTHRRVITLRDEDTMALRGTFPDETYYDLLLGGADADVLKPDGSPLLLLRHAALPGLVCRLAQPALRRAVGTTANRGIAAGGKRAARVKRDGTLTKTTYAPTVESAVIGHFDRTARFPYCRMIGDICSSA